MHYVNLFRNLFCFHTNIYLKYIRFIKPEPTHILNRYQNFVQHKINQIFIRQFNKYHTNFSAQMKYHILITPCPSMPLFAPRSAGGALKERENNQPTLLNIF